MGGFAQGGGGATYAQLALLAYVNVYAAGKFVADATATFAICKVNHSNGCMDKRCVLSHAPQSAFGGDTGQIISRSVHELRSEAERWNFLSAA
jgi:hypothetical protein